MKKWLIGFFLVNLFCFSTAHAMEWIKYSNGRYDFSLEIPRYSEVVESENGDGCLFIETRDVYAGAWGAFGIPLYDDPFADVTEDNFLQYYLEEMQNHKRTLGYHTISNNAFVLSYTEGYDIIYHKSILNKRDGIIIHLEFRYPKSLKKKMDPIVERASKTLKFY